MLIRPYRPQVRQPGLDQPLLLTASERTAGVTDRYVLRGGAVEESVVAVRRRRVAVEHVAVKLRVDLPEPAACQRQSVGEERCVPGPGVLGNLNPPGHRPPF